MSFWAELKRRNVVRVGAVYLAAAWFGLVDYFHDSGNWGDYCRPISGGADFECN